MIKKRIMPLGIISKKGLLYTEKNILDGYEQLQRMIFKGMNVILLECPQVDQISKFISKDARYICGKFFNPTVEEDGLYIDCQFYEISTDIDDKVDIDDLTVGPAMLCRLNHEYIEDLKREIVYYHDIIIKAIYIVYNKDSQWHFEDDEINSK